MNSIVALLGLMITLEPIMKLLKKLSCGGFGLDANIRVEREGEDRTGAFIIFWVEVYTSIENRSRD